MQLDFQPDEQEFEIEAATEVFPFAACIPKLDDISKSDVVHPLTYEDFNRPLSPAHLGDGGLRSWLLENDFKACSIHCSVPFQAKERRFFLPPEASFLADPVTKLISDAEKITSFENVFSLSVSASSYRVAWEHSMLAKAWHIDADIFYDCLANTYVVSESDERENLFFVASAFPFATQFHKTMSGHEAELINYPSGVEHAQVTSVRQLWANCSHPFVEPARGHSYAWTPAHVHRSPVMPASKGECLQLLKDEEPDLIKGLVNDEGVIRTFIRISVARYHPDFR